MCRLILSVIILLIDKLDSRFVVVQFCWSLVWLQTELDSTRSYYHYKYFSFSMNDEDHSWDHKTHQIHHLFDWQSIVPDKLNDGITGNFKFLGKYSFTINKQGSPGSPWLLTLNLKNTWVFGWLNRCHGNLVRLCVFIWYYCQER